MDTKRKNILSGTLKKKLDTKLDTNWTQQDTKLDTT